ncbi:MAG TPA: hypothetical protein VIG32_08120 [Candidatus Baltobacteraceae bacterium]
MVGEAALTIWLIVFGEARLSAPDSQRSTSSSFDKLRMTKERTNVILSLSKDELLEGADPQPKA